ncbi:MAG: hypothetical protein V4772_12605 [Pseudomonadota bacterium]
MSFIKFLNGLLASGSGAGRIPAVSSVAYVKYESEQDVFMVSDDDYAKAYVEWCKGGIATVARLQLLSTVTAIGCLDKRSGYLREFSLRVLMAQDWVNGLRPVLRRLNDYVEVNRDLSSRLVLKWLAELPFAVVIEAIPEIYALQGQSRANFAQVLDAVHARLKDPQNRDLLLAGVGSSSPKVRKHCWQLCLEVFEWTALEKVEYAIQSGDAFLARNVESLVDTLSDGELQNILNQHLRLKAAPLRRAVYVSAWRRKLGDTDTLLALALWDRAFLIRWIARHWYRQTPAVLAAAYRRVLAEESAIRLKRHALEGLEQLRQADTVDCCEIALADAHPTVRKSALEALCSIAPAYRHAYLVNGLHDKDMAVLRKSFEISLSTGDHLAYDDLLPVAQAKSGQLEFFVWLIGYAGHVSVWLSMHLVSLTRFADADVQPALQANVREFLGRWCRQQIYVATSPKQWADISAWLPNNLLVPESVGRFVQEAHARNMKTQG